MILHMEAPLRHVLLHEACGVTKSMTWCLLTHCAGWETQKDARWKFHNLKKKKKKDINEDVEEKGSNTGCFLLCKS